MTGRRLRAVTPDVRPRAILYLRQSKPRKQAGVAMPRTAEESISFEVQETAGRDYCARRGYDVAYVIRDQVTGLMWEKRAGIQETLRLVAAGNGEVVVLYRWSRISRRKLHQAVAFDAIERAGGRVESSTEPFDTGTAGGRFGREVMLAAAVLESEQKAEQWAEAHARRLEMGLPPRGGDRFGYVRTAAGYDVDPVTGPVLAEMYLRYLDGAGFTAVARWLNDAGYRTSGGRPWDRDRVTKVLDSGWAAGRIIVGHGPGATLHNGGHLPVIDLETWEAYQVARATRRGTPPRTVEPVYVLSGLIRCGDEGCGAPMHANRLGVRAGYGYLCSRWARTGEGRCVTITRAKAEAAVLVWLREWAADADEAAKREAARAGQRVIARHDAADLARAVVALDKRLVKLVLDHNAGLIPNTAYVAARDELTAERGAAEGRRVDAETRQRATTRPGAPIARAILADWDILPVRTRRDLLAQVIERVEIRRGDARNDVSVAIVPR